MKNTAIMTAALGIGILSFDCHQVVAETEVGLADMTRLTAAEGMVLLKNDNQILPLTPERKVSIFGRIQVNYFACGYGSGGDVKTPYVVNILDAMRRHPGVAVNENLGDIYEAWCQQNPPDNGSWGNWPLNHPEMPLSNRVVAKAALDSDTAVVIIGRSAGEDREAKLEAGSYYLTDAEKNMLGRVNEHFEKIAVLINSGNIIDMSWVNNYANIDSVMYLWQGGMQGGTAVADVLSGDVSPSGKLTATIAKQYRDYPTSGESSGEKVFGGWNFSNYVEDIYVGYRYFETFSHNAVQYPFGYGLSYTDFEIKVNSAAESDGRITVDVVVKNTGSTFSGKEVIQIYYGAPQGKLGKATKSLAAYAKTKTLAPGESENIQLSFNVADMASYDDAGVTGHKSAYVLEEGTYPIYVGSSVRNAMQVGAHVESQLRVTEQLTEVAAVSESCKFPRMKASLDKDGNLTPGHEDVPTRTASLSNTIAKNRPRKIAPTRDRGIKLIDVFNNKAGMKNFVAQFSIEELEAISRGDYVMGSSLGAAGNAAVYGGVTQSLRDKGVVPVTAVDGPSGVRLTASASLLPIGTALACTWNDGLVEDLFRMVGSEMILNHADVILAPGMNIQRDPLGGRNFEYFSEDPLLTGQMGANAVRGLQSQGVSATPKHFGLNNQETNRSQTDSRCSERAIREIYAKAFEIVVKTAQPHNIMASYNRINGVYSHYNYDLYTSMLREEWGYDGVVMTDWWMQCDRSPDNEHIYDNAYRIQAQVDVLMPGVGPNGGENDRSLLDSYEMGEGITLGEMQRCAMNTLKYVIHSPAFRKANGLDYYEYQTGDNQFGVKQKSVKAPRLASLTLNGKDLAIFNPLILDYYVYTPEASAIPKGAAVAAGADRIEFTQPTASTPVATIKVSNEDAQAIYRVYFTDTAGMEPSVEDPVFAKVTNLYVNGEEIPEFYPGVYEYSVVVPDINKVEIDADVPEGVTIRGIRKLDRGCIVLRAESPHQAMEYKIHLAQHPKTDNFDDGPGHFWSVHNQTDKLSQAEGTIRLVTEKGDLYNDHEDQPDSALKNYIAQPAGGSWEAVVKADVNAHPSERCQSVGLMILQDTDNYLHFRHEGSSEAEGVTTIHLSQEHNGSNSEIARNSAPLPESNSCYFKVIKSGDNYTFSVSADGEEYTQVGAPVEMHYPNPKFVLCASNGSAERSAPIEVRYDYVHFNLMESSTGKCINIASEGCTRVEAEDFVYKTTPINTQACKDVGGGLNVGWTGPNKYLLYLINVKKSGNYTVSPRIASNSSSLTQLSYAIELNGDVVASFLHGGTGGWQNWESAKAKRIYLEEGSHKLCVRFNTADINMNCLEFRRGK